MSSVAPLWTTICVIGAGPRGISVLERICANAARREDRRVLVHLVDPHLGDGGQVWRTGQPSELLMNTIASQVTMFTDDTVDCAGPVVPGPSLYEWAKFLPLMDTIDVYPAHVRKEAGELGPDSYPSRAFYGHYLSWVLRRVVRTAPPHVSVRLHRGSAIALDGRPDGGQCVTLADGSVLSEMDTVVLAQGHVGMPHGEDEARLAAFAAAHGLGYQPPINPADAPLERIKAGEPVALRGMGLNFFDYTALLTVVRGGRFVREHGRLSYHPSGREPLLYAGSRRGVPYHARGENQKGASGRHEPFFLTQPVIDGLRLRMDRGMDVEFRRDVWPMVSREVEAVYYHALLAERGDPVAAEDFLREYLARDVHDPALEVLRRHGISPAEHWDWELIARPFGDRRFADRAEFRAWLLEYLRRDYAEALRGNVRGPLKAAMDVLRDLRNEIRLVVDHSGISGRSYREELQAWYTPLNAYLSIGPPASRIEELIALIEAGVLHVLGPGMRVEQDPAGRGFLVRASAIPGSDVLVTTLVEARLPEVDVRRSTDPLLRQLWRTGQCGPYRIPDGAGGHYETGGLAITRRPYHLVDATGRPNPRRFAFGVPTEAVHWVTAAGIRPGVNSVILSDADAIARACLAVGRPGLGSSRTYLNQHIPLAWLPTSAHQRSQTARGTV
ncbi:FAD/NAD(P)-binding protein [Crossiella sp. CA198]|uniref:FAD/NAD(P)-binding protein n=1 Tax=Crossiella sp. CA198 TaxID=3455607 RepID=UPI003F8D0958